MSRNPRAAAARAVGGVVAGHSLNETLPAVLGTLSEQDRALAQQLCYGTLRMAPMLAGLLESLLDKPLRDKERDVHGLLLVGLYQLVDTRVPEHAAVAATVDAVAALKKPWARGLVNAILRRFLREREALVAGLDDAAAGAHPAWLYAKLQAQWPTRAPDVVAANNQQPPLTLRVNRQRNSREHYLALLERAALPARPGSLSPDAVYLDQAVGVALLPEFNDGAVSVQDEAAQMAAHLLPAAAGERILDACAAPGGKSCHILELHPDLLELVAMDTDAGRLERVRENLQRLRLSATLRRGDAKDPPRDMAPASFDHILVDAPCSATGAIRRNPDIKLLRRASDVEQFAREQLDILRGLWPLLRAGGSLLYATCSVLEEENSQVIQRFLAATPAATIEPLEVDWGHAAGNGRQLLPGDGQYDGLFYARVRHSG